MIGKICAGDYVSKKSMIISEGESFGAYHMSTFRVYEVRAVIDGLLVLKNFLCLVDPKYVKKEAVC